MSSQLRSPDAPAITSPAPARGRRLWAVICASAAGILIIGILDLVIGTPRLSPQELWLIVRGGGPGIARVIVLQLRLPRFVLGVLAGAMLALSGALLQGSLRNPLAGPELLGVSAGATVVVAAITILHLSVLLVLIPWLALAGGVIAGIAIILFMRQRHDSTTLLLTGAAMSALLNAAVIVLISYGSQADISLLFLFLVGSLANRTWMDVQLVLPWAIVCIPLALSFSRLLNIMQLGDDVARGLGLSLERQRVFLLLLASALVAAVVAVCGPISFVALLVPQLVRRMLRTSDARMVLPSSALAGALLLTAADLLARQLFAPQELPVGIFTALIGGPALIALLRGTHYRTRDTV